MNQALDCGDLDGYNKISRTQDSLRKSSKFAAKDRQKSQDNAFDSVGELVAGIAKNLQWSLTEWKSQKIALSTKQRQKQE